MSVKTIQSDVRKRICQPSGNATVEKRRWALRGKVFPLAPVRKRRAIVVFWKGVGKQGKEKMNVDNLMTVAQCDQFIANLNTVGMDVPGEFIARRAFLAKQGVSVCADFKARDTR